MQRSLLAISLKNARALTEAFRHARFKLPLALKGAAPDLRDKILRNMSSRAAEMLKEDLEAKGPVRLSEVENEQKEILKIARRLADEGQIVIGGGGGDDAMV